MRARIVRPCARANSSEVTTSAAAPSFRLDALPAVTDRSSFLPSFDGNAGRSLPSDSAVVSLRGPSSVSTVVGPLRPGICTGAISSLNFPASIAAIAFACDCAGELVLHLSRDAGLLRRVLGVAAHVDVAEGAPQAVLDHAVDERLIAELHAAAHSIVVIGRVGHRLLAAGDDDLAVARLDRLRGEHHGLEPRAAHLVDRQRRNGRGNARLDRGLPRRRLSNAALDDVAHDDFFDVVQIDAGALERRREWRRRQAPAR